MDACFFIGKMPKPYVVKKGQKYGRWQVIRSIEVQPPPGKRRRSYVEARCLGCGNIYQVLTTSIVSGRSTQCASCRASNHGEKVKVVYDGVPCQIKISSAQQELLKSLYGNRHRPVGYGVRKAIAAYRKNMADYYVSSIPAEEVMVATTVSISQRDKDWLKETHNSIHHGIYCAIRYFLSHATERTERTTHA